MIVKKQPNPEEPDKIWGVYFQNGDATANIAILQDKKPRDKYYVAFLYQLESKNRNRGDATRLMQEINEYCLREGIMLVIEAEAYDIGPGCLTQLQLKHFYQKLGAHWVERLEGRDNLLWGAFEK